MLYLFKQSDHPSMNDHYFATNNQEKTAEATNTLFRPTSMGWGIGKRKWYITIRIPCHARIKFMKLMKKKHWKLSVSFQRTTTEIYVTWWCMHTMSILNQPTKESYKNNQSPTIWRKFIWIIDHRGMTLSVWTYIDGIYRATTVTLYVVVPHVTYALEDYRLLRCYFLGVRTNEVMKCACAANDLFFLDLSSISTNQFNWWARTQFFL